MAEFHPPEGLRKVVERAIVNPGSVVRRRVDAHETLCDWKARAVLAALFEACEVRERWGTRWINGDIEMTTAWWRSREEAEIELSWPTRSLSVELIRRCDLQTPTETVKRIPPEDSPVSSTGEEPTGA